jgi:hypothetical protein
VVRKFNVRIPLREGITLSADLVLPEKLPAPVVVVRTPYGKAGERQSQRGTVMAKGGYACMHVDVRGRGDSDGSFQPYRNDGRRHDHRDRRGHRDQPALAHPVPPVPAHRELTPRRAVAALGDGAWGIVQSNRSASYPGAVSP